MAVVLRLFNNTNGPVFKNEYEYDFLQFQNDVSDLS